MVGEEENPFRRALEWFESGRKWRKATWSDNGGCAMTAPRQASSVPISQWLGLLEVLATQMYPNRGKVLVAINDHPDTTWEDIEALFEKAAVRWEERVD